MLEALIAVWLTQATPGKDFSWTPLHDWFKSLRQPRTPYASCCDLADCHMVEARTLAGEWEVQIERKWVRVPQDVILKEHDNPTGHAVACYYFNDGAVTWFCFVAPAMT